MTGLFLEVVDILGTIPVSKYSLSDAKWDQLLFQGEAFIRLGSLLVQKAAYYIPGGLESRDSLEKTYSVYLEAKMALRDNYDEVEAQYPIISSRIENALNDQATLIVENDNKINEAKKRLIF